MQQGFRAAKIREKQVQFLQQKVRYDVINAGCKRIGFKFLLILEGLFCCLCWLKTMLFTRARITFFLVQLRDT